MEVVRHQHVASSVDGNPAWGTKFSDKSVAIQRADVTGRIDLADPLIIRIRDIDISYGVHRHAEGTPKLRSGALTILETDLPIARHRSDYRRQRADLADIGIALICHEQVTLTVDGQPGRPVKLGLQALAVGRAGQVIAGARQDADHTCRADEVDRVVLLISHIDIPLPVGYDAEGASKGQAPGRITTGQRADQSIRVDLPDPTVVYICHVRITVDIARHAKGRIILDGD